jgi:hypothetical protein
MPNISAMRCLGSPSARPRRNGPRLPSPPTPNAAANTSTTPSRRQDQDPAAAVAPRHPAPRTHPVADALRDRRPRRRNPLPQRRRPRPREQPCTTEVKRRRHRIGVLGSSQDKPGKDNALVRAYSAGTVTCLLRSEPSGHSAEDSQPAPAAELKPAARRLMVGGSWQHGGLTAPSRPAPTPPAAPTVWRRSGRAPIASDHGLSPLTRPRAREYPPISQARIGVSSL